MLKYIVSGEGLEKYPKQGHFHIEISTVIADSEFLCLSIGKNNKLINN